MARISRKPGVSLPTGLTLIQTNSDSKGGVNMASELAVKGADAFFDVLQIAVAIGVAAVGVGYILNIVFAAL